MSYKFGEPGKYTVGTDATLKASATHFYSTLVTPPKYVGGYRLGDRRYATRFNLTRKPSAWHRFWTRAFLGWTWEDDHA